MRQHIAPYATVTGGITFSLHDPQAVSRVGKGDRSVARGLTSISANGERCALKGPSRISPCSSKSGNCCASMIRFCLSRISSCTCALTQIGKERPAICFDNIAGYSSARVAINVHRSWCNHALALGMEKDASMRDQFVEFVRRFQLYPASWSASRARPGKRWSSTGM